MTRMAAFIAAWILLGSTGAWAFDRDDTDIDWGDIIAPYRQRIDGMTSSSGNAKRVNAVTHMITPWPPYVRNRKMTIDGERMFEAMDRYRRGPKTEASAKASQSGPASGVPNTGGAGTGKGTGAGTSGQSGGGGGGSGGQGEQ